MICWYLEIVCKICKKNVLDDFGKDSNQYVNLNGYPKDSKYFHEINKNFFKMNQMLKKPSIFLVLGLNCVSVL